MPRLKTAAFRAAAVLSIALPLASAPVGAQDAASSEPEAVTALIRVTDSLLAYGELEEALALLEPAVDTTRPQQARLWHRYGMTAWRIARPQRSGGFIRDRRIIKLLEGADSALNLASQLAPDSARFALDIAKFYLDSDFAPTRGAAVRFTNRAVESARRTGDGAMLARAAVEHGRVYWRRYESTGRRALSATGQPLQLSFSTQEGWTRDKARDFIEQAVIAIDQDPNGTSDLRRARELFDEAVRADADFPAARRNQYMVLAELEQWQQLRDLSVARTRESPFDADAWFAAGLAWQRLGRSDSATVAFDSALVRIAGSERGRLTALSRILRPTPVKGATAISDTAAFGKLNAQQRDVYGRLYWQMADPLSLTNENEYEAEFLARVAYAEIRFSDEDAGIRGADTDRGDIHIRYGPPSVVYNTIGGSVGAASGFSTAGSTLTWIYDSGLVFTFDLSSAFGRARIALDDRRNVEAIRDATPVSFENVDAARPIDTIPVRYARFRAGGDSLDILVAARVPFPSLVEDLELEQARVQLGFRVLDQYAQPRYDDTREETVDVATAAPSDRRYDARIGAGFNLLRVEAFQPERRTSARALLRLAAAPTSGFGISDVLLSRGAEPKAGVPVPRRWRDLALSPALGVFRQGEPVGMVWETYELAERDGGNRYRVSIEVAKLGRGGVLGFAGRVLDGAGQALGRGRGGRDGVEIGFDRELPAAPVQVEFFTLELSDAQAGTYRLTVTVEDRNGRGRSSATTTFQIAGEDE